MKYFILILFSLNISTAYANECSNLFHNQRKITEKEIKVIILDLYELTRQKYSEDLNTSRLANSLFKQKIIELQKYLPLPDIQSRIKNIALQNTRKQTEIPKTESKSPTPEDIFLQEVLENIPLAEAFLRDRNLKVENSMAAALERRDFRIIKALATLGANLDSKNKDGMSALHLAAREKEHEFMKYLISRGADINSLNKKGITPLLTAITYSNKEAAHLLVKAGADVNIKSQDRGVTALFYAIYSKNYDILDLLLQHGADVNAKDEFETPILHYSAKHPLHVTESLVKSGADVHMRDIDLSTTLQAAATAQNKDLVEYYIQKGVDPKNIDLSGNTVLLDAVSTWNIDIIKIILKTDVDININNENGFTALDLAKLRDKDDIVKLLKQHGAKQ